MTDAGPSRMVVGMDFSRPARDAARWAGLLLGPDVESVLVYVLEPPTVSGFLRVLDPGHEEIMAAARAQARDALARMVEDTGLQRVTHEVREGKAAEEISALAQEVDADVVVGGAHGARSGLRGALGSTAEQLVRVCPVPVLVVTNPSEPPLRRILVPVDDSDLTLTILRTAGEMAARTGASLSALHAVNPTVFQRMRQMGSRESAAQGIHAALEKGEAWLRSKLSEAGLEPEEVEARCVLGDAAHEIVAGAARVGAGLIVMGSRGAGSPGQFLLGSVTRIVLANAPCPLLLPTDHA